MRRRRGYIRDNSERDLAAHLETALRGMIIAERWPKSSVEVIITVLEGADLFSTVNQGGGLSNESTAATSWSTMSILAACITVASAAIADAGIDCVDLVVGGVAAVLDTNQKVHEKRDEEGAAQSSQDGHVQIVLDPCPSEHANLQALCVVGYMPARDEITQIWVNGSIPQPIGVEGTLASSQPSFAALMDQAVYAATQVSTVLIEAVNEASIQKMNCAGLVLQPS